MTSKTPRWLMAAETALIIAAPYVYMQMPHEISSDGYLRLETTRYLALGQVIDQPVPLLFSILALPLYHFGDVVALFNMVTLFAGLAVLAALFWKQVPAVLIRRFVLIVLAASMFPHHTQVFFGELLTAMLTAIGIALMVTGWPLPGTTAAILGVVNQPASAPALLLMLLDRAKPPYRLLKAAWPLAACVALLMLEFYLRRGSPFASGYEGDFGAKSVMPYSGLPGFSYPIVFGLLSILFSFGKGLALFVPGLWLLFKRPVMQAPDVLRRYQRHAAWFVAGLVIVYAKWWAWPGGWFWGPRFFVFACIPASIALAIHLSDERATPGTKALTIGLLGWSAWVGINGAVYGQLDMSMCNTEPNIEPLCWYSPEYSALFRPFIVSKALTAKEQIVFGYSVAAAFVLVAPFLGDLLRTGRDRLPALARRWLFA
jgi:hypothetical protein